ncbi:sulfite exporter TauE/SafE family protein [Nitratireductor sp. GISD-1A_MAKvit]|uniref:sulfite exporter TauE/SafE family protein n=1 Tax=Nitratireductor sp. GISD-1A_MAKvit TaxID=3234198 RepID=UPI0034653157
MTATVLVAGVVRGLSGFGTGLIVAPIAGALYDPVTAVVLLVIIDSLPTLPVALPVVKLARWREVLPVLAGLALFVPLGVYILKNGDETTLRWVISIVILACALTLRSGWRYHGPRGFPVSFGVGGIAGTLSGIAAIPGPPVIIYWMASSLPVAVVRANLMTLFLISEVFSAGNLWLAGLFDQTRVTLGILMIPPYVASLAVGTKLYGIASETAYRRLAFMLIVASALVALPLTELAFRWLVSGAQTPF